MKRARHRWIIPCVVWCVALGALVCPTRAVRATSLIFAKTTSTAAPTAAAAEETAPADETAPSADGAEKAAPANATKLTGIPQIDYIHDPNLPRELNGYNLSEYPFYEAVPPPETMSFKCDGLHDGFYASVPHKCQVYHHCLFGTRYDFLCANYTAFDQKTFICHFVSEVDCKNSPNYFSRNEALYKAATTVAPTPLPTTTTTTSRPPPPPRRRPYDYYDDYYEPTGRDDYEDDYSAKGGRRRPRPKGRPLSRRPYDEYEDDRYETRPRARDEEDANYEDRRRYERPGRRKRPGYYDERRYEDEDRKPYRSRRPYRPREDGERPREDRDRPRDDRDRVKDDRDETYDDDRVKDTEDVKSEVRKVKTEGKRDDVRTRDEIKPRDEVRPQDESRHRDDLRPRDAIKPRDEPRREDDRPRPKFRPREENRRYRDEDRDEVRGRDDRERREPETKRFRDDRYQDRERDDRPLRERNYDDKVEDKKEVPLVKPAGHTIYSAPRVAPKIKRPVPLSEKDKFEYKTTVKPVPPQDDYYYDLEEEDTRKPSSSEKSIAIQKPKVQTKERVKFKPLTPRDYSSKNAKKPEDYEYEYDEKPKTQTKRLRPLDDIYDDYDYEEPKKPKTSDRNAPKDKSRYIEALKDDRDGDRVDNKNDRKFDTVPKPQPKYKSRDEPKIENPLNQEKSRDGRPNVKVIKRPFLPSRGGSPYLPRGLQPIGGKNHAFTSTPRPTTTTTTTTPKPTTSTTTTTTTTTEAPTTTTTIKARTTTKEPEEEYYYDDEELPQEEYKPQEIKPLEATIKPAHEDEQHSAETQSKASEETYIMEAKKFVEKQHNTDNQRNKEPVSEHKYPLINRNEYKYETTPKPEGDTYYKTTVLKIADQMDTDPKTTDYQEGFEPITETSSKATTTEESNVQEFKPLKPTEPEPNIEVSNPYSPTNLPVHNIEKDALKQTTKSHSTDSFIPSVNPHKPYNNLHTTKPYTDKYTSKYLTNTEKYLHNTDKFIENTQTTKPYINEIKQNLADSFESDYDVTLNEATPTTNNIRNFPTGFYIPERDYTYTRFRNQEPDNFRFRAQEPTIAASDNFHVRQRGVSIRSPSTYYTSRFVEDRPRVLVYRQVGLGDYVTAG